MNFYVLRLIKLGFSVSRAYEVFTSYRESNSIDELDRYITALECSWEHGTCG